MDFTCALGEFGLGVARTIRGRGHRGFPRHRGYPLFRGISLKWPPLLHVSFTV